MAMLIVNPFYRDANGAIADARRVEVENYFKAHPEIRALSLADLRAALALSGPQLPREAAQEVARLIGAPLEGEDAI